MCSHSSRGPPTSCFPPFFLPLNVCPAECFSPDAQVRCFPKLSLHQFVPCCLPNLSEALCVMPTCPASPRVSLTCPLLNIHEIAAGAAAAPLPGHPQGPAAPSPAPGRELTLDQLNGSQNALVTPEQVLCCHLHPAAPEVSPVSPRHRWGSALSFPGRPREPHLAAGPLGYRPISSRSGRCPVLSEGWGKWKRLHLFPRQIQLL